jgi:hypothetical protein
MPRAKKEHEVPKIYMPHSEFTGHMRDLLHFLRQEQNYLVAGDAEKERNLRRMKNHYLDRVFQAMADLNLFFQAVSKYPELQDEFEQDIKDLLGIRRTRPRNYNYAHVFVSLVHAMISTKRTYGDNDFRIKLIYELQKLLASKTQELTGKILKSADTLRHVNEEIGYSVAWSETIASSIKDEYDFEKGLKNNKYYPNPYLSKPIPSEYLQDENKKWEYVKMIQKQSFEEWDKFCAKGNNRAKRSIDFDVEKLLDK